MKCYLLLWAFHFLKCIKVDLQIYTMIKWMGSYSFEMPAFYWGEILCSKVPSKYTTKICLMCVLGFFIWLVISLFWWGKGKRRSMRFSCQRSLGEKMRRLVLKGNSLEKGSPLSLLYLKLYWTTNPSSPPLKSIGHASELAKNGPTNNPIYILNYILVPTSSHHHRQISIDLLNKSIFFLLKIWSKIANSNNIKIPQCTKNLVVKVHEHHHLQIQVSKLKKNPLSCHHSTPKANTPIGWHQLRINLSMTKWGLGFRVYLLLRSSKIVCKGNLWMGTTLSIVYHVHLGVVNCFTMVHFGGLPHSFLVYS
jgi:hypothetical protein